MAGVFKGQVFPLGEVLTLLLKVGEVANSCPVEMEFAVDLTERVFYVLQMRPMNALESAVKVDLQGLDLAGAVCHSRRALGHGLIEELTDIVYVKPESFKAAESKIIAREIGEINDRLRTLGKGYVLIGPGRWGSADPNTLPGSRFVTNPNVWAPLRGYSTRTTD